MEVFIYIGAVFAALVIVAWTLDYDDEQEEKEMENMEEAKDKFFQMIDEVKQKPERIDYDAMWGVSGYYNDNDGNDIRDRD